MCSAKSVPYLQTTKIKAVLVILAAENPFRFSTVYFLEQACKVPLTPRLWFAYDRCVFIHDPRVKGPNDAWLYSSGHGRHGSTGYGGSGGSSSPFGRDTFYWPDMVRTDVLGNTVGTVRRRTV